jgi:hypothetical protein
MNIACAVTDAGALVYRSTSPAGDVNCYQGSVADRSRRPLLINVAARCLRSDVRFLESRMTGLSAAINI